MSKQNLFVPKVKNHVSRNAFDLSQRRIYSAKAGEILPCFLRDCLPGDKVKVKANAFTRTAPLNNAAFARMKQYFNFYFVPYRLLYRDFPSFVIQQSASSKSALKIDEKFSVPNELPHVVESDMLNITQGYYVPNSQHPHESLFLLPDKDGVMHPTPGMLNRFGLSYLTQTKKLLQYLGYYRLTRYGMNDPSSMSALEYGVASKNNTQLSLFPLLAYQKVYNDFYRFSQWEDENPSSYNVDYMAGGSYKSNMRIPIELLYRTPTYGSYRNWIPIPMYHTELGGDNMFSMRYVNYTKDSFLGVVPTSQFGAVSTVESSIFNAVPNGNKSSGLYIHSESDNTKSKEMFWSYNTNNAGIDKNGAKVQTTITLSDVNGNPAWDHLHTAFDILSLRSAQAKQKFMEVTLSNNSDYKSQVEAHFNVKVSSLMSNLCDYIGGFSSDLSLDTVVNNNLSEGNTADYSALATMSGDGGFDFTAREHGLIIGVSYILPFVDYEAQGYDFPNLRVNFADFALPEYDRLGYEEVDTRLLTGYSVDANKSPLHIGYGPRYYDYKTNVDIVLGDFNGLQDGTQPIYTVNLNNNASDIPASLADKLDSYVNHGIIGDTIRNRVDAFSFKVSPTIFNNLFTVKVGIVENANRDDKDIRKYVVHDDTSFDQFYNVVSFNTTVISNLDRLGLPY